jgi:uncharacterized protein YjdB/predicted transcriptional regulator
MKSFKTTLSQYSYLPLIILFLSFNNLNSQQLAFPSAKGAGAYTTGGRGGVVVHVTSLADSGPGSLREALQMQVPRIIVFDVSGIIYLNNMLYVGGDSGPNNYGNFTIAGQTAPEGGITIDGDAVYFTWLDNIIVRHIRFKGGARGSAYPFQQDGLGTSSFRSVNGMTNQIFDHCSFSYGKDETAEWYATGDEPFDNITIQKCFYSQGQKGGILGKGINKSGTYGDGSFLNNMFYNNRYRFPNVIGEGNIESVNNVMYNINGRLTNSTGTLSFMHIGNYYDYGIGQGIHNRALNVHSQGPVPQIYTSGNKIVNAWVNENQGGLTGTVADLNANNKLMWRYFVGNDYGIQLPANHFTNTRTILSGEPFTIVSAEDAFENAKADIGCNARLNGDGTVSDNTDVEDLEWLTAIRNNVYEPSLYDTNQSLMINTPIPSVSRTNDFYISNANIPEAYLTVRGITGNATIHNQVQLSGYTLLEEYLNQVDGVYVPVNNPQITRTDSNPTTIEVNGTYIAPTGTWTDVEDGNGTATVGGDTVDTATIGTYNVTLFHTDSDGNTGTLNITYNIIAEVTIATDATVTPAVASIQVGNTIPLTAVVYGVTGNATDQSGVWTSNNGNCNVDADTGLVTGVTIGSSIITFTSSDGAFTDTSTITVTANTAPTAITFVEGESANPNWFLVNENTVNPIATLVTADPDVNAIHTYTIQTPNVDDYERFSIVNGNQLQLNLTPDFENPLDTEENNIYALNVRTTSSSGATFDQFLLFWIQDIVNETAVPVTSVSVTPNTANLFIPETITVTATINPDNATNQNGVWSSSDESIATVDSNGLVTPVAEGDVTITFTTTDGGFTDTSQITVFPEALQASAGDDQQICQGDTATLTASGGTNYVWNTGETTESIELTPNETTIYTVTVSDNNGQSEDASVTITVNAIPVAYAGEDQTICEGESITLTATEGTTYLWSTGETTASIEVSPSAETIYSVEVTSNTCSITDSVTVFVDTAPNITVSSDIVIVDGESTTLAVNGSDNYQWSTGETAAFINVAPTVTTTYIVSSLSANGCSSSLEVTVTVIPEVIADAGSDITICRDESVTINATGGVSYLWNTGDTTSELIVIPLETTTYTVTVEDGYGYTDTDSVTITVNETPDITVSADIAILDGETTALTATGGDNYQWVTGETTATISVTPNTTTTYTVISTAVGGCADIEQVTVTVIPEVIAYAGEDTTICSGEVIILNAIGGTTYLWNTGDTTSLLEVSPMVTTTYTVTVEDDYGYNDSDSVTITVNETPNISVSNDITIMDGESTTLSANEGSNYLWSTGETSASIVVNPSITTTYSVSSLGAGDCEDIKEVTVTVVPELIANAGANAAICSGESITLNASGGISYLWNTGETSSQLTVSPTVTTNYSVTVADSFGNTDTDSVTITVNETPNISVSNDITIMDGESTTLSANEGSNYLWSTGETSASIVVNPSITTTYSVSSLGAGDCEDTKEVTITVVPELIANAGANAAICSGESITLNASGGISYLWNTGDTSSQLTISPTVTTNYSVTVTDSFGNTDTDSVTITVNDTPNISVSNDITIMDGESTTLIANEGSNYLWSTGETSASIVVNPSITTTYSVSSLGVGDCEDTEEVTVTVVPELIANAGANASICIGDSITLNASGGISYLWNTGDTSSQLTVSPTVTTNYSVTVADSLGNTDTDSVTITVNEMPNVTLSENITIVAGESTSLIVNGAQTYQWNTGETSNMITVSPTQTTTYTVIATANTCTIQAQVTVTVESVFEASAGTDERVCQNDIYEVVLSANQGDSYLWNTGETSQSITVSPLATSTYTVTVSQGSQQDTDNVTVYVDPNPEVVILNGDSIDIMNGDFITLSASGANSYQWNNGATQPNIAVSPSVTTTYEVKGFIGDCFDEKQITVNVIPEVTADAGDDVSICLDEVATLTASGGDEYVWSTGETTQTIEVSPSVTTEYTVTVFNAVDFDEDTVIVEVNTDCDDDIIEGPIEEPIDFVFQVFPNPATNLVNIKLSGSVNLTNVYLYDITGKLIHKARISNENLSSSSTTKIDISQLQTGIYYIKMVDINRDISKKLIVN